MSLCVIHSVFRNVCGGYMLKKLITNVLKDSHPYYCGFAVADAPKSLAYGNKCTPVPRTNSDPLPVCPGKNFNSSSSSEIDFVKDKNLSKRKAGCLHCGRDCLLRWEI
ncbi:unnamed protein product [Ceratitis capitata]|uniref:(Mediterranean fruit fly) hypothetical protein n=1 Tax=Ceratitis capitata TaxID=7213 RepID=A0A811U831_CERCA|nr:unnamed protein product [Ceratitis capitata]